MSSDPQGLLHILEFHGQQIYALLTRLTLRAGVADDLLQELFLKLHTSTGLARAENQTAYVFRAAIHLAFDWRRRRRETESLQHEPPTGTGSSPMDRLIAAEEFEQVVGAMQDLSELTRECLVLRFLQQQEYHEIAGQLGKTEHQVRALCHKGLDQLRSILAIAAGAARESEPKGMGD